MRKKTLTAEVVIQYMDKWPNTPNLTLAKKIYKENIELFTSVDQIRSMIRTYKGRKGAYARRVVKDNKRFDTSPVNFNPFGLPGSEAEDDQVFTIPAQYNRLAVFADLHIPYHDVEAITVGINHAKENKCNAVLINGDAVDFYSLSRFLKDPRMRDFAYELDALASVIKILHNEFGKVFYKKGNHEERLEKYLRVKAPELLNVPEFQIENLMAQRDAKCEVISHHKVMAGKMPIVHAHEFGSGGTSSVNPARGAFLKALSHCMVAHSHRTSQHTDRDITGKVLTTFSVGCLCGLYPEFARINKWNHGFAEIFIEPDGAFDVHNYRIHKGKVWQ